MTDKYLKDADESELAARIREAIGAGPTEEVGVVTPQFERGDGVEPGEPPLLEEEFEALATLSESELKDLGLRPWGEHDLWLFPAEWYPHIPAGLEVMSILGQWEEFEPGVSDDDRRHGVLPYGIQKNS